VLRLGEEARRYQNQPVRRSAMAQGPGKVLLVDEANNQNLLGDPTMRAVLNINRHDDYVARVAGREREPKFFRAFSPLAIGAVGRLPNDLHQRCIVIDPIRCPPDEELEELNDRDPAFLMLVSVIKDKIKLWAATAQLDPKPDCGSLRNRYRDNWRPLIAVADSLGYGEQVREVAQRMTAGLPDDDVKVLLLEHIRDVFAALGVDRIFVRDLLAALQAIEGAPWSEWTGINGDLPPRPMNATQLAGVLAWFKIRPRTVAGLGPHASRGPTAQGYRLEQFEPAWRSYCRPVSAGTAKLKVVGNE
jgi:hypothetical protein